MFESRWSLYKPKFTKLTEDIHLYEDFITKEECEELKIQIQQIEQTKNKETEQKVIREKEYEIFSKNNFYYNFTNYK